MYVKMSGLYGMSDSYAYYQKIGDGCFQFTYDRKHATDMSEAECRNVLKHGEWYMNQYNADMISIMEV